MLVAKLGCPRLRLSVFIKITSFFILRRLEVRTAVWFAQKRSGGIQEGIVSININLSVIASLFLQLSLIISYGSLKIRQV